MGIRDKVIDLLFYIISHLHVVFILRTDVFLNRAKKDKKSKVLSKIKKLFRKRKISYKVDIEFSSV